MGRVARRMPQSRQTVRMHANRTAVQSTRWAHVPQGKVWPGEADQDLDEAGDEEAARALTQGGE